MAIPSAQTGLISNGVSYSTDGLSSSTPPAGNLDDDNVDDGTPGVFGGVDYASVSPLYTLVPLLL